MNTVTIVITGLTNVRALMLNLADAGKGFTFNPLPGNPDTFEMTVAAEDEALLLATPAPVYALVQEGGSSTELYIHAHTTTEEADADRVECARGAYRTSEIVEIPADVAALGEAFYAAAEYLLGASHELNCVAVPEDENNE